MVRVGSSVAFGTDQRPAVLCAATAEEDQGMLRIKDGTRRLFAGCSLVGWAMLVSMLLAGCGSVAQARGAAHERTTTQGTIRQGTAQQGTSQQGTAQSCPLPPVGVGTATYGAAARGAAAHDVALTFDDGPSASSSPAILSFLERTHTPATFFVIGAQVKSAPAIVQREVRDGFVVGVHTWDHPDLTKLSAAKINQELTSTVRQIHSALGAGYCVRYFRPPYGAYNTTVLSQARTVGLAVIMWNVDPADWSRPGTQTIINRVLKQVKAGSIILMHDGPSNRQQTAAALPSILAGLKSRGLTPVTLPQLLANAAGVSDPAPNVTSGGSGSTFGTAENKRGTRTTSGTSTTNGDKGTNIRSSVTQHSAITPAKSTTTQRHFENDGDHDADDQS
jgi:peptidoglycan/xylan/chitin deacetylase (PgdA/CDA1 family)